MTAPTTVGDFTIDGKTYPGDRREITAARQRPLIEEPPAFYGNSDRARKTWIIIRRILGLAQLRRGRRPGACGPDRASETGPPKKYSLGMKSSGWALRELSWAARLFSSWMSPLTGWTRLASTIRSLIRSLPEKLSCTVLVSSHLLPEIELMADDVGILNRGRLLFEGSMENLRETAAMKV